MQLGSWELIHSGKVRELFTSPENPGQVLLVASDRVSAFDHALEPGIPDKGALLTQLSRWWFGQLDGIRNHLVEAPLAASLPPEIAERSMLVYELDMLPIECVVRGYVAGSAWTEYQASGSICGVALPDGLQFGDRLPEPIFTPAFKAQAGEHDENITFESTVELIGAARAERLRALSLEIYSLAAAIAEQRGILLADTKFEFGELDGEILLADEVLTSDSSRYWDAEAWAAGERKDSFDKQLVRNWLLANWDQTGTPPRLPDEIVALTAARYRELIERLTA